MIEIFHTGFPGLVHLRPKVFTDDRGQFTETFNARRFADVAGIGAQFVQDNESRSARHVLRGLHFQAAPHAQGKLVRVAIGAVIDVCVDLRRESPMFGKHFKIRLDDVANDMLFIPPGMAHGFLSLADNTVFTYKCTAYYAPQAERTLLWSDPALGIDWGVESPLVSPKDQAGLPLAELFNC